MAKLAGVSHMTVSRVVRNSGNVKASTIACVRAAIEELGYIPDPTLSALAAYRSNKPHKPDGSVVAFLDYDQTDFSQKVLKGAQREALMHGYRVECHSMSPDLQHERRLSRTFYNRGIRGLVFGPAETELTLGGWEWKHFASVSLAALTHTPAMHAVAMDYYAGSFSACRMLQQAGLSRIGLAVLPKLDARTGLRWRGGYAAAMGCKKLCIASSEQLRGVNFAAWCKQHRLEAVLTIDAGLLEHWSGPRERFVLLNSTTFHGEKQISWLSTHPESIGCEGIRLLHHLLLHRDFGLPEEPKLVSLKGVWRTGNPDLA